MNATADSTARDAKSWRDADDLPADLVTQLEHAEKLISDSDPCASDYWGEDGWRDINTLRAARSLISRNLPARLARLTMPKTNGVRIVADGDWCNLRQAGAKNGRGCSTSSVCPNHRDRKSSSKDGNGKRTATGSRGSCASRISSQMTPLQSRKPGRSAPSSSRQPMRWSASPGIYSGRKGVHDYRHPSPTKGVDVYGHPFNRLGKRIGRVPWVLWPHC